ncbi:MAG: LytTR family DNA-binding domain-containing protein [Bacteroidales bacterium]
MQKIRSVIVEDEKRSREALIKLLSNYCPEVEVVATAGTVAEAIKQINQQKPALVFLDISLPDGDAFRILESFTNIEFEIIFVTAFNTYATRAFEFSALHYLLKPINYLELQKAVGRYTGRYNFEEFRKKMDVLDKNLNNHQNKIILPTAGGLEIISLDNVMYLEANHNYTNCYLTTNDFIMVSKPIGTFESSLSDVNFARIHSKYLINLKYVKKYIRGLGGSVILTNGTEINVSKSRKTEFLLQLEEYAKQV